MKKKLAFHSVLAFVIGSQIGSGVFLLPASLAQIGSTALFGWIFSGAGAIFLALVFAKLSLLISREGGPHVYIGHAFGPKAAFFAAWTYWLVSWASSIAVIVAAVGYLSIVFPITHSAAILFMEIAIITFLTFLNMRGAVLAGSLEFFLTILKCLPLLLIPLASPFFFHWENLRPEDLEPTFGLGHLNSAILTTFWGFIGLEAVTTIGGIVENPSKTIPRAILAGTLCAACIYFLNSLAIMGVVPNSILARSQAPYAVAAATLFGSGWDGIIACIACIACIGTLNAWVLTSGQIAAAAAKDALFPPLFGKTNRFGAPHASLWIAMLCTIPLLVLTLSPNILEQLTIVIDISVITFLFLYLACAIALIKVLIQQRQKAKLYFISAFCSILFCIWVLLFVPFSHLLICSLLFLSGIPIYLRHTRKTTAFPSQSHPKHLN